MYVLSRKKRAPQFLLGVVVLVGHESLFGSLVVGFVQELGNVLTQFEWVGLFGVELDCHTVAVDEVFVKVVSYVCFGHLLLQALVDGVVVEGRQTQHRKRCLGIPFVHKGLDFFVGGQLLTKVVGGKSHDRKTQGTKLLLKLAQFRVRHVGFASFARHIHHQCNHPSKLVEVKSLIVPVLDRQTIDGVGWQQNPCISHLWLLLELLVVMMMQKLPMVLHQVVVMVRELVDMERILFLFHLFGYQHVS